MRSEGSNKPDGLGDGFSNGSGLHDILVGYIDRLNAGEMIHQDEILAAHPSLASDILAQLELFQKLSASDAATTALGTLGDYKLLRQIGRGGMGREASSGAASSARRRGHPRSGSSRGLPEGGARQRDDRGSFTRPGKTPWTAA